MSRATPTVLVVDDDAGTRDAARMVLEDEGFHVEVARDGREAIERLENGERPSLLLVDLAMPAMDGRALVSHLESRGEWSDVPIVLMTAGGPDPKTSGLRYPLLRKPFGLEELLRLVTLYSPRQWDRAEPPTMDDTGVRGPGIGSDTRRDRCVRCGSRASGRCPRCGDAYCRKCLPTATAPRCERCARDDGAPH